MASDNNFQFINHLSGIVLHASVEFYNTFSFTINSNIISHDILSHSSKMVVVIS